MEKKNLLHLILGIVLIGLGTQAMYAQTLIRGRITSAEAGAPVQGATVKVTNAADSVISSTSSDPDGKYAFASFPLVSGSFIIRIQILGYESRDLPLSLKQGQREYVLDAGLSPAAVQLEEVAIQGGPEVKLMNDTTEFDVGAYKTEPYADSDALIGQLPGVEIDGEGNIIAQGEQVTRILVDGKEFFSTDPRIAMKNLPADIIDKIQIIDERSERSRFSGFDDGVRNKVINIVTRPDRRSGYFGRAGSALGNLTRYNVGGHVNFFENERRISITALSNNINQQNFGMADIGVEEEQGQGRNGGGGNNGGGNNGGGNNGQRGSQGNSKISNLALNYSNSWRDKIWKFSGDYSLNNTNSLVRSVTNRETLIGANANQLRFENADRDRLNRNHRLNMRLDWEADSVHLLTFRPRISLQNTNGLQMSSSLTNSGDLEPINRSTREQINEQHNFSVSGSLDYRIRLGRGGRNLSLNTSANLNRNKGLAQNISLNEYYQRQLENSLDTVNNQNNTETLGNGFTGRLTYSEPLNTHNRLAANYSLRNNSNFSNRETLDFLAETGQYAELNRQLSNTFNNDYLHHSAGLNYQYSKNSFQWTVGLDYQQSHVQNERTFPTVSELERRFVSFLPNMNISYRPSRSLNLRMGYTTSTNSPTVNQLQEVINNQSPTNIRTGNADLNQEYQHQLNLSINKVQRETGRNLNISLNGSYSNDRVVNATWIAARDTMVAPGIILRQGGQFAKPVNVDGYYNVRGNVSFGSPIKALKLNLNLNTGLHHGHSIGMMNSQETFSDTYGVNQRISINSRISEKLLYNLSYSGNYTFVKNSANEQTSYNYFNQTFRSDLTWIFWKGVKVGSSLIYNKNAGLSQGYDQSFMLWNASLGKKFLKKQQAELTLSAYDLLKKNKSITRMVSENFITDVSTNILQQYFMLGFTYNLRHFGGRGSIH